VNQGQLNAARARQLASSENLLDALSLDELTYE
jgi:hypothetical protein